MSESRKTRQAIGGWLLLTAVLVVSPLASAVECGAALRPFRAEFQVERNGKVVGKAVATLKQHESTSWDYRMETTAEHGIGGLLGGNVTESTRFTALDQVLKPFRYRYRQKVAFSKRRRDIDFDWHGHSATGNDGKRDWRADLQGDETDRLLSGLQLMLDLSNGARGELRHLIMDDDGEAESKRFVTGEMQTVQTPAGSIQGLRVERDHGNASRSTVGWYSPDHNYLPVKIERRKSDGDSIIMTLSTFQSLPCGT